MYLQVYNSRDESSFKIIAGYIGYSSMQSLTYVDIDTVFYYKETPTVVTIEGQCF